MAIKLNKFAKETLTLNGLRLILFPPLRPNLELPKILANVLAGGLLFGGAAFMVLNYQNFRPITPTNARLLDGALIFFIFFGIRLLYFGIGSLVKRLTRTQ